MSKPLLAIILLIALGVAGYLGFQTYAAKSGTAAAPATKGPGPSDPVLDAEATPGAVMGAVTAYRKQEDQDAEEARWVGQYLPATGWKGPCEVITEEAGGAKAYRMRFTVTGLLTNELWVVAVVPDGWQYYKGFEPAPRDFITVGGRIDKVEVIPPNTYKPVPDYRIVLKDAYVMEIGGK